ncbi:MAG: hypothetical protein M1813_000530 [Trichoglossum hirsutum]|nr:MAG: hypothetical protein M1813_000530 [Trichoglossum hirsutum]
MQLTSTYELAKYKFLIPAHLQTPKTLPELRNAIDLQKQTEIQQGSAQRLLNNKISKAAATAMTECNIWKQEYLELKAHTDQKQKKASKKRKRVPGVEQRRVVSVGEAFEALELPCRRGPTRAAKRQRTVRTLSPEVEDDEDSIEEDLDSEVNSCIIVVVSE